MKSMMVYMTANNLEQAQKIGETLVDERLVACVNILDNMKSIYRWKGVVERDNEVVLITKTKESLVDAVVSRVTQLHSYEVPCIVAVPIESGNPEYLQWIQDETR